ncbi:TonB-dependent receptor [Phenylobacterium sp.]|uniref:TonB-dependent receptor n=1 Tax=Phenylobacterium sp. TaxID=1871053 RepID=UPI0027357B46|nr:TonB-dependent receptor [Phenylobacterium sp.]MDP3633922.1 TonB-dependent receptor [Phenylobacterium sp.]MDZ4051828.1 TonB-dependent receptor [Phenylobacterium sp.]
MTKISMLRAVLAMSVSTAALSAYAPAFAQDADDSTLETLVVTANRREESANTVGMAIQAFRGEQMRELHVTTVKDLASVVPSFSVSQSYQGVPTYTLRGIGFNTINLSATSTVGTYVDEVAYAYPMMNTGPLMDLERVEVLKGPQGTLYGRNTTAGLIDFVTNKPTEEFQAGLTAEVGNYRTHNFEGYVSGPLAEGVQARFAFRTDDSDEGWQKSNTRGERQGEIHRYGFRASLAMQPSEALSIDASLTAWKNKSDTVAAQGVGFTPATAASPFNATGLVNYIATHMPTDATQADWAPYGRRATDIGTGLGIGDPLRENNEFKAVKLRVAYDLGEHMRLVSLSNYNTFTRDATFDWSGAPYEILVQKAAGKIRSIAEELRLEGETDSVNWLVGVYVGKDKLLDSNRTLLGDNANVGTIRFFTNNLLLTPFNSGGYTALQASQAFRTYRDQGDIKTSTQSVFANADWQLGEQFKLTTGLRYTKDKQNYAGCSRDFNGNMLPNVNITNRFLFSAAHGLVAPISQGDCNTFNPTTHRFGLVTSQLNEDNFAWRVALNWTPTENLLAYASVSRGAKAGVTPVNAANISTQNAPASQELLLAYEVGLKAALFDRRVQANASVFYYDYEDKQLSVYFADPIYTALARLANVPKSMAYGLDGDVTWRMTPEFTAIASGTWLHTEVQDYVGINSAGRSASFDGKPFLYSPKFQGSMTLLYRRDLNDKLGIQAAVNGRYQSKSHADLEGNPLFVIPEHGLLNASLGLHSSDDRWEVSVWGRNLTDEYYWSAVSSNANVVVRFPGQTRTFGASFTVKY